MISKDLIQEIEYQITTSEDSDVVELLLRILLSIHIEECLEDNYERKQEEL